MVSPGISHDSLQSKERNVKAGYPHLLDAAVDNAAQVQLPPAPSSVIPSLGESNEPVSHKRKRQSYNPQRKFEVAAVRKVGACKDCRRKKTRCPHALQPQPANESATQGTVLRLQNSTSQDFPAAPSLCGASLVRSSDGSFVMTSVSPTSFKSANQFSPHQWDQLDSIMDSQNHSQMYAKHPSMQEASTRPKNEDISALEHVDEKLNPFFQRSADSQTTSYLRTGEDEQILVAPACMPYFLGENEPWDQKTGREMKQTSYSRYHERLQSSAAHRNTNRQDLAAPQTSPSDYGFLVASTPFYSHGYHDAPTQISEMTSINSQTGIPSLVRPNLPFATSHSSSLGADIAPGDFYYNNMAPEGLEALSAGLFDTRMPGYVTNATEPMPPSALLSQYSPTQDVRDEIFSDSGQTCPLNPVYKGNAIFGANLAPGGHYNTPGGYNMPLLSSTAVDVMLIRPHDVVPPQGFLPSDQICNDPNNFTIPGNSTDHNVGNPNLTYVQSHDMPYADFLSNDFELSNSSRSPPSALHNYPLRQIRPYDEHMSHSSRPSLVPSNFQRSHPPSVPQPQNVWANAATRPASGLVPRARKRMDLYSIMWWKKKAMATNMTAIEIDVVTACRGCIVKNGLIFSVGMGDGIEIYLESRTEI